MHLQKIVNDFILQIHLQRAVILRTLHFLYLYTLISINFILYKSEIYNNQKLLDISYQVLHIAYFILKYTIIEKYEIFHILCQNKDKISFEIIDFSQ